MSYNQTFPNAPQSKPNENNIICSCTCCQCCCPCCYCQCKCQCHQQSISQTEENKKINEDIYNENNYQNQILNSQNSQMNTLMNQDSINNNNNNFQNYPNFPIKYGNQKINDDVDCFNQQLIQMKMRMNMNNSNKKNNSFSNTTNDNSPNVSKSFNSPFIRNNNNNNFYDNENYNPCNNYNNNPERNTKEFYNKLNNMKNPNDDYINRNDMNNGFNQNSIDFNTEYTTMKPMKKKENQRPYSSNRRNINISLNNDINNFDRKRFDNENRYYYPNELNFLNQTEYNNNNNNNRFIDCESYYHRNSFDKNSYQNGNKSFGKLNTEPKKRVFNSKFQSNSNNNFYKQIPKNPRNSFSKKYKLYIQNFRLNIVNEYQGNLTDSNYESKNTSTNRNNLIIQEQKEEINRLKNEVLKLKNENGNLQKLINNFNNDNENNNQIINLENENKELIDNLNLLKNNMVNLENENKELIDNINLLKDNAFNLENEKNKLLNELKNLNMLKNENKKMKEQLILYQSSVPNKDNIRLNNNLTPKKNYDDENSYDELSFKNKGKTILNSNNTLKNPIHYNKHTSFDDLQIHNNKKLTYKGIPYTEEELLKKITISKKKTLGPSISTSKLMTKLKLETDLNIIQPKKSNIKVINNIEDLGDNLVLKYYNKNIMCYDMNSKNFYFFDFADYNNFSYNFINDEDNGNIFLSYNSFLYILTGKNYDMFYSFNPQKKAMEKLCSLKNNHSKGCLIPFNNNSIICLSGQHNKKCEIYSILKNEWNDMCEMNIERCEFGCCIIQNQYLFSIFGYNYPKNEYLNTIEYLDLLEENSMWKYLNYNNDNLLSLYIKGLLSINYNDEKIILVGGFNGELNKPVEEFYQLILGNNFKNDCYVEDVNRKLKDIQKNKLYMFNSGITEKTDEKNRLYNIAYDNDDRIHIFEIRTMTHDVFNFE